MDVPKIGRYAKNYFQTYFADTTKQYDITHFLNKYWCLDHLGIRYPLLKEVDISKPITEQKNYNNNYGRYWIKPVLEINGRYYILCSEWYKEFKPKLTAWIMEQDNNKRRDEKIKVVPKPQTKKCGKCGTPNRKEYLIVTYNRNGTSINNTLVTYRCEKCQKTFIDDSIYKSYTRSKALQDLNVKFEL